MSGIQWSGVTFTGGDMLLYEHGNDEGAIAGRIVTLAHAFGAAEPCFPPPGSTCLAADFAIQLRRPDQQIAALEGAGGLRVTHGAAGDSNTNGRSDVALECARVDFSGTAMLVGDFHVRESATLQSPGRSEEQTAGTVFPADSFFDLNFEIELVTAGITLVPPGSVAITATATTAVPALASDYVSAGAPLELLDKATLQPSGYHLVLWQHRATAPVECGPPPGVDCALATGSMTVEIFALGTDTFDVDGTWTIVRGPERDAGGGAIAIDAELVAVTATGSGPMFGAVSLREDIDRASTARFDGLVAGVALPATAFVDAYFVLETATRWLRPVTPVHLSAALVTALPLPSGTQFTATGLPLDLVDAQGVVRGRLHAWTHVAGAPLDCVTDTGAGTGPARDTTSSGFYRLRAAHPNPFATRTTIAFELDRDRWVRFEIFNARGERVRRVHAGPLAAGTRSLLWDGRNDGGRDAGRGVYFYRLGVDDRSVTRKLVKAR